LSTAFNCHMLVIELWISQQDLSSHSNAQERFSVLLAAPNPYSTQAFTFNTKVGVIADFLLSIPAVDYNVYARISVMQPPIMSMTAFGTQPQSPLSSLLPPVSMMSWNGNTGSRNWNPIKGKSLRSKTLAIWMVLAHGVGHCKHFLLWNHKLSTVWTI
jgi:hypothetical protein